MGPGTLDDILLLWNGDEESLNDFMATLNDNEMGIVLTYEVSSTVIHFLDLEISIVNHQLITKTFFKPTDRNGYIPVDSRHYSPWLKSVPCSQLLRIRRNCTDLPEFFVQANTLKSKFVEKGYLPNVIDDEILRVSLLDRSNLTSVQPKRTPDTKFKWSFTTQFSVQHKQVKDILNHHSKILKSNPYLGPVLPDKAGVIYRGAPPLRNRIAPNVINPPMRPTFFQDLKGYYPCGKCNVCMHNTCGRKSLLLHLLFIT